MQFKLFISMVAIFMAWIVVADPVANADPNPITLAPRASKTPAEQVLESDFGLTSVTKGKKLTKLASSLYKAQTSMNSRSDVLSAWSVFQTAAPSSVVKSVEENRFPYITTSAEPAWFSKLPGDVKKVFLSEQSVRESIITKVLKLKDTTSTSKGPAPRVTGEVVMGMVAAGAVGAMALL